MSIAAVLLTGMLVIYFSTFETGTLIMFPGFLLVMGLSLNFLVMRRVETDLEIDEEERYGILKYTLLALAGIVLVGWISNITTYIPSFVVVTGLNIIDKKLFSVLIAVAEETFFRGFMTNWLLVQLGPTPAIILGGLIGGFYHFAVYGGSLETLLFVVLSFTILTFVAVKSGRLSPTIFAHSIFNAMVT